MDSDDELVITHDDCDLVTEPVQVRVVQTVTPDPEDDIQVATQVSQIWMTRSERRRRQRPESDTPDVMGDIDSYLADAETTAEPSDPGLDTTSGATTEPELVDPLMDTATVEIAPITGAIDTTGDKVVDSALITRAEPLNTTITIEDSETPMTGVESSTSTANTAPTSIMAAFELRPKFQPKAPIAWVSPTPISTEDKEASIFRNRLPTVPQETTETIAAIFESMRNPAPAVAPRATVRRKESKNEYLSSKNSSQVAVRLAASQSAWDKVPVASSTPRKSSLGSSSHDTSQDSQPSTSSGRKRSITDRLVWTRPASPRPEKTALNKRAIHDARLEYFRLQTKLALSHLPDLPPRDTIYIGEPYQGIKAVHGVRSNKPAEYNPEQAVSQREWMDAYHGELCAREFAEWDVINRKPSPLPTLTFAQMMEKFVPGKNNYFVAAKPEQDLVHFKHEIPISDDNKDIKKFVEEANLYKMIGFDTEGAGKLWGRNGQNRVILNMAVPKTATVISFHDATRIPDSIRFIL